MHEKDYLSLQAIIVCLLLALIGSAAIIKHPDWFGQAPEQVASVDQSVAMAAPWIGLAPSPAAGTR